MYKPIWNQDAIHHHHQQLFSKLYVDVVPVSGVEYENQSNQFLE